MRRQNPLELVFENISTFDAENPIVGSLLREIDIKKKKSDSGFIKSLPSHPGKEFEIKKDSMHLETLKTMITLITIIIADHLLLLQLEQI